MKRKVLTTRPVFARRPIRHDPPYERILAAEIRGHGVAAVLDLYAAFKDLQSEIGYAIRRVALKALCKRVGHQCTVEPGVQFKHPETFSFGNGDFIGTNAFLQGWHRGSLKVGDRVWIGPGAYLHCCDLTIGDYVGIGPGVMILGNQHVGRPVNRPIIDTDLEVRPVVIESGADIGMGAKILPGVRIGRGSVVGAGAVVTKSVPPYSVAVGVPAQVIRKRK